MFANVIFLGGLGWPQCEQNGVDTSWLQLMQTAMIKGFCAQVNQHSP